MSTLSSALVSALSLVTAEVAPEVTAGRHEVVRGALAGNHALVYGLIDPPGLLPGNVLGRPEGTRLELTRSGTRGGCVAILRATLTGGPPELIDLSGDGGGIHWPTRPGPIPLRWRLAGGVLFRAGCSVDETTFMAGKSAVGRLQGPNGCISGVPLTAHVLAAGRVDLKGEGWDRLTARTAALGEVKAGHCLVTLRPVDARFGPVWWDRTPRRPEPELWRTHYDFLPVGPPDWFELYISDPGGLNRHYSAPRPELGPTARGWKFSSTHPPAWVGPFYVVTDGADRHFVVPGGRVFTLPADAKSGDKLTLTWDKEPILALVHDSDAGKSYAFTRTHYFHITAKPDPKPHGLKAFPGATAEEALDTVTKCGRVIRGIK